MRILANINTNNQMIAKRRQLQPVNKVVRAMKGKKGKKSGDKYPKEGPVDEALFERELAMAIQFSKIDAGIFRIGGESQVSAAEAV